METEQLTPIPGIAKTKEKPLSSKHQLFIQNLFANSFNATQAYKDTYPDGIESAEHNATRLMGNDGIRSEIKRQQLELITKMGYSKEQAHQDLMDDRQLARDQKQPSAAITADSQLIRLYGMDQVEAHRESTIIVINPPSSVKKTESEVIDADRSS